MSGRQGYPVGPFRILEHRYLDLTAGMNGHMPQGGSVEFLGVSGTISVGPARAMYDFTWVIYHMHIDEISWVIFSTLDNALVDEFSEDFWETINFRRKDRWGFFEVPWIDDREAYDVAPPYTAMQLPIFDSDGHTTRLANPFIWNHNYVKVHPNGALIYAEDKKLAFFLPYMVETYNLLPTKPLLWVQDNKNIPLHRETLWLHESTIKYLAETGDTFPPVLHDEITPRLARYKPTSRSQPPQPPQASQSKTRWQERTNAKSEEPSAGNPSQEAPQASQPTPQQVSDAERAYAELQAAMVMLAEQTVADSIPDTKETSVTAASAPAAGPDAGAPENTDKSKDTPATKPDSHVDGQPSPAKVNADTLIEGRPKPPPVPAKETPNPSSHEDTPGTGELSSETPEQSPAEETGPSQEAQQPPMPTVEIPIRASPVQSPGDASDTIASETVLISSPEPAQVNDIETMDIDMLQEQQYITMLRLQRLNRMVTETQNYALDIATRIKRMRTNQGESTHNTDARDIGEMEKID